MLRSVCLGGCDSPSLASLVKSLQPDHEAVEPAFHSLFVMVALLCSAQDWDERCQTRTLARANRCMLAVLFKAEKVGKKPTFT